ncbi:MAG: hypothetical protein M1517_01210 [Deltaproteobacteria bacterium]|nr:hypothetical protein [Deltaproteobacteria bacterium]
MVDNIYLFIFGILLFLMLLGRVRAYVRTGLVGDLVAVLGGGIIIISAFFKSNSVQTLLGAIGLIIGNIGLMILATIERAKVKEIYAGTSFIDKITGNLPTQFKDKKYPIKVERGITLKVGMFSIILSIALYFYGSKDISDLVIDGILFFGGIIFLITAYTWGNKKDDSRTLWEQHTKPILSAMFLKKRKENIGININAPVVLLVVVVFLIALIVMLGLFNVIPVIHY